jgi:hypothetical protein
MSDKNTNLAGAAGNQSSHDNPTNFGGMSSAPSRTVFLIEGQPECIGWLVGVGPHNDGQETGTMYVLSRKSTAVHHGSPSKTLYGVIQTPGTVEINDSRVSSQQGAFEFDVQDGWFLHHNILATNKTFLNGEEVKGRVPIKNGDKVKFGRSEFIFKCLDQNLV